jgi:hypothetical protein
MSRIDGWTMATMLKADERTKQAKIIAVSGHALNIGLIGAAAVLCASTAMAQTARDIRGPAPVVPLAGEPPAKIVIDPPLADSLAHGRVVIQYKVLIELVNANHQTLDKGGRHPRDSSPIDSSIEACGSEALRMAFTPGG